MLKAKCLLKEKVLLPNNIDRHHVLSIIYIQDIDCIYPRHLKPILSLISLSQIVNKF